MSKIIKIRKQIDEIEEINMTPVMSLFVILIPFLLLAAVFVKINIINSPFPKFSGKPSKKQEAFLLNLYIKKDGFSVQTTGNSKRSKKTYKIGLKTGEYQYEELQE